MERGRRGLGRRGELVPIGPDSMREWAEQLVATAREDGVALRALKAGSQEAEAYVRAATGVTPREMVAHAFTKFLHAFFASL